MQERDAYRIALLNAKPADESSFRDGWLSALTWQTGVLVDALASAGLHGNSTQTVLRDNTPQAAETARCPYVHCGWNTYTQESPQTLLQLHLTHAHPLPPPRVYCAECGGLEAGSGCCDEPCNHHVSTCSRYAAAHTSVGCDGTLDCPQHGDGDCGLAAELDGSLPVPQRLTDLASEP